MIGWGAVVPDPQLLLEYLSQEYSDTQTASAARTLRQRFKDARANPENPATSK